MGTERKGVGANGEERHGSKKLLDVHSDRLGCGWLVWRKTGSSTSFQKRDVVEIEEWPSIYPYADKD